MLDVVQHITTRLAAALAPPWAVVNGATPQNREHTPRADVRMQGAALQRTSGPTVALQPTYVVRLVVEDGGAALPQLDQAMTAAIASLHNWPAPGQQSRLALVQIRYDEEVEQGLMGYLLAFSLTTTRQGCQD